MESSNTSFGFPFIIDAAGRVAASGGDEAIRGRIIQVLFTAPGERVNMPDFGCGLFNLVFEPNNTVLASAMEFTVGQALARWMGDEIQVEKVQIEAAEENISIEVVYAKKSDLSKESVRFHFK